MSSLDDKQIPQAPTMADVVVSLRALFHRRETGTIRILASGSIWSLLAQIATKASVLVFTICAARSMNLDQFGLLMSLQASALLVVALWDFGTSTMLSREVATTALSPQNAVTVAAQTRIAALPLAIFAFALLLLVLGVPKNGLVVTLAMAGVIVAGSWSTALLGVLQGQLRFRPMYLSQAFGRIVTAVLAVAILIWKPASSLALLSICLLVGEIVTLQFSRRSVAVGANWQQSVRSLSSGLANLKLSAPYLLNTVFNILYSRMDIVLVSIFAGVATAGIYAPASRAQDVLMIVPATVSAAIMPWIAKTSFAESNPRSALRVCIAASALSVLLSTVAILLLYMAPSRLVQSVLGAQFSDSVSAIRLILFSIPIIAFATPFFSAAVALGGAKYLNFAYGAALLVTVVGNATLASKYGAEGAAAVAVARDAIAALLGVGIAIAIFHRAFTRTQLQVQEAGHVPVA